MAVNRITISVPERMFEFISARVSDDEYGSVSEYFRELVRRDQRGGAAPAGRGIRPFRGEDDEDRIPRSPNLRLRKRR